VKRIFLALVTLIIVVIGNTTWYRSDATGIDSNPIYNPDARQCRYEALKIGNNQEAIIAACMRLQGYEIDK
jgi:hypothetical protein